MMPSRSEGDRIPFHSFNLTQQSFSTLTTTSLNFFSIRDLLKIEIPIILYSKLYLANIHQSHQHRQYKNVSSSFSRWKLEKWAFVEEKHCLCNKCLPVYIKQPPGLQTPQRQRLRLLRQDTMSDRSESIPSRLPPNPGCFCCSLA